MNAKNDARFHYSSLITSAIASLFITVGITSFVVGCSGSSNTDLNGDGGSNGGGLGGLGGLGGGGGGGQQQQGGGGDKSATSQPSKADSPAGAAKPADAQCTINTYGGAGCDSCIAQSCCNEVKTCKANGSCMQAWNCAGGCGGDQDCIVECINNNPNGKDDAVTLAQCGNAQCPSTCK
jgi:hypothetical protein